MEVVWSLAEEERAAGGGDGLQWGKVESAMNRSVAT